MTAGVAVRLEGASRRWGDDVALDGIDLEIDAGQRVGLIGPSGSGKSTLLNLVAGALATTGGGVYVGGELISSLSRRGLRRHRARCGIIPQNAALVPQVSVHRNVLAGLLPGWPWYRELAAALYPMERERVHRRLWEVGLEQMQFKLAANLSGGEKQRVAIARAQIGTPSLIIADEPTASLDPTNAKKVIERLANCGATLLISTHWVRTVRDNVDRLIGLRDGRVVLDETPQDLSDNDLDALYRGSDERR